MAATWLVRALAFDRSGLQPAAAARAAIGIVTPLVVGAAVGHPAEGAQAAAGALPVGVAAMTGDFAPPTGLLLSTTAGMTVSTFVGSLVAGHRPALLLTLAVWGFAAGLVVTLGRAATIVGVQAVVAFVVFGRYPGGVDQSAAHALWVLGGGLLQTALALLLRPPRRFGVERQAVAAAYDRLASLAGGVLHGAPGAPVAEAIAVAAGLVARRSSADDAGLDELRGLTDEAGRLRLELQALASLPPAPHLADVTAVAATWLHRLGAALRTATDPGEEPPALAVAVDHLREHRTTTPERFAAARAAALLGQLRAAHRLAGVVAGLRRLALPKVAGVPSALELSSRALGSARRVRLAIDSRSSAMRHAVRLAVLLPAAEVVATALPWPRGYWVALTTLVVLKPDYATTMQRGAARVAGTSAGVVVAGVIVGTLHPRNALLVVLVGGFAWASYAVFSASYAVYTFVLTALVVLLVSTFDARPLTAVADRGLDTLIGGGLALLGYAAWPTREAPTLRATTLALLDALADYAAAVLDGYVAGRRPDDDALVRTARAARQARAQAQASLDRATAEPARMRPDIEAAASVLAAARRIVISLHAMRTTLHDTEEHVALPEAASVAADVVATLHALSRLEASTADLREQQHRLEEAARAAEAGSLRARRLATVAAHLDPLVDSVDTVEHVLMTSGLTAVGGERVTS